MKILVKIAVEMLKQNLPIIVDISVRQPGVVVTMMIFFHQHDDDKYLGEEELVFGSHSTRNNTKDNSPFLDCCRCRLLIAIFTLN
jgi:hypothetical protein